MPPISIVEYAPDGDGGWFVKWCDEDNGDGEPLEAFFHAQVEDVDSLLRVRSMLKCPENALDNAASVLGRDRYTSRTKNLDSPGRQKEVLSIPDVVVPYANRDWAEGYELHVGECIDRIKLNVVGHAPYDVLEDARNGGEVPVRFRRETSPTGFSQFIQENGT